MKYYCYDARSSGFERGASGRAGVTAPPPTEQESRRHKVWRWYFKTVTECVFYTAPEWVLPRCCTTHRGPQPGRIGFSLRIFFLWFFSRPFGYRTSRKNTSVRRIHVIIITLVVIIVIIIIIIIFIDTSTRHDQSGGGIVKKKGVSYNTI